MFFRQRRKARERQAARLKNWGGFKGFAVPPSEKTRRRKKQWAKRREHQRELYARKIRKRLEQRKKQKTGVKPWPFGCATGWGLGFSTFEDFTHEGRRYSGVRRLLLFETEEDAQAFSGPCGRKAMQLRIIDGENMTERSE